MTDALDRITKEQELATYKGPDRVEPLPVVLEEYRRTVPEQLSFKTGFPSLDREIGGVSTGQLVVVSGTTGSGKTTTYQSFTRTLTAEGCFPLWLSYEVPVDDFALSFNPDYHGWIVLPVTLKDHSLTWIEDRIIEAKLKYGTKAVFIDHLHYLVDLMPKGPNMSLVVGEVVRRLKRLAVEHRVIVFLVAHTMKTRFDEEPDLGSIRDSSFVEQEADTVLYTFRWKEDPSVTVLKVAKNRKFGRVGARIPLVMGPNGYVEKAVQND